MEKIKFMNRLIHLIDRFPDWGNPIRMRQNLNPKFQKLSLLKTIQRPSFVNLLRSPGIDSQPGGSVRQPYLWYGPDRLHRLAESIPGLLKRLQILTLLDTSLPEFNWPALKSLPASHYTYCIVFITRIVLYLLHSIQTSYSQPPALNHCRCHWTGDWDLFRIFINSVTLAIKSNLSFWCQQYQLAYISKWTLSKKSLYKY